jgi:hypothetical protein
LTSCGAVSGACALLPFEDDKGAWIAVLGLDDETAAAGEASWIASRGRPSILAPVVEGDGGAVGLLLRQPMGERD